MLVPAGVEEATFSAAPVGNADTTPEHETAKEALEQRIQLVLQSANESSNGWRKVIMGGDANKYCTKLEILQIWQRSIFCVVHDINWHYPT